MDGSSLSLILIPIVVTISLAAWLILVAYAAGHPQWKANKPVPRHEGPGKVSPPAVSATAGRDPLLDGDRRQVNKPAAYADATVGADSTTS
jgi:hypothetical protein